MGKFVHFEKVVVVDEHNRPREGEFIKCKVLPTGVFVSLPKKEIHPTSDVKKKGDTGELRVNKLYANSRGWKEAALPAKK